MSRIGKLPITIPAGVNLTVDNDYITVTGPKGTIKQFTINGIKVGVDGSIAQLTRSGETKLLKSNHGLMRSLINNMVVGVSQGFSKSLELTGVGYRVSLAGNQLKLYAGFSHELIYKIPEGITIAVEQNIINISGISKQQVGQVAAEIRSLKKPEPYKGKGLKYVGERIIRKSGKSGKEK